MPVSIASYARIYSNTRLVWVLVLLTMLLQGCQSSRNSSATWKIYRNPRYQFEFPYPSNWIAAPMPDNRDTVCRLLPLFLLHRQQLPFTASS